MSFKEKISLKDAIEFIVDNRGKTVPTADTGIALIATNCINNSSLYPEFKNVRYISDETFNNWFRAHPKPDDIIFTLKGSQNGAACLVPQIVNFAIAQDMVALRANKKLMDPYFLLAALRSKEIQYSIKSLDVSDVIPHLKKGDFDKLLLPFPKLDIQKSIGEIFITLERKIELNRQMNQILEAMAQALFKSWFVDFDPVMDNALAAGNEIPDELQTIAEKRSLVPDSMKLLSKNPELAEKFPSSYVFNESLGKWIPEGWEVKSIGDIATVGSAKRIFANEYKTSGVPFFRGKEITLLSQGSNFDSEIYISEERFSELKIKNGVPEKDDILLTSVGTIGNTYLVEEDDEFYFKDGNLTWFSNYKTEISGKYLKTWFDSEEAIQAIDNIKIGSTQQAITISSINTIKLIHGNDSIITEFNKWLNSSISERQLKTKQTKTLIQLRDKLLPELISGRVRVPE